LASSVYRRRVTVDLLLLTISGLADELYSSVVSSWSFPCIPSPPTPSVVSPHRSPSNAATRTCCRRRSDDQKLAVLVP
jgi:hypothetical protein